MLFLSYAEEDSEKALKIIEWLSQLGLEVYDWQDPRRRGGRYIEQIEEAINRADGFVALTSPRFVASPWCRMERDLAVHREQDLQVGRPDAVFIHVLRISDTAPRGLGFLRNYDWADLTGLSNVELVSLEHQDQALHGMADRLRATRHRPTSQAESETGGATSPGRWSPSFRNRHHELELLSRGLSNPSGPHFWLVIAPPELGKTWFLHRLSARLTLADDSTWVARLVDLRNQPAEVRADAAAILARFFDLPMPAAIGPDTFRSIAQGIFRSRQPYLCLLDSAELLDETTVTALREALSEIYRLVQQGGDIDVRLGFVAASRRDDKWRGVAPDPRLSSLPLTEFKPDVVQQALRDLAAQMGRVFDPPAYLQHAARVHRLSEGLPALLVRCLQWIRTEEWLGMERLDSPRVFEELAHPYIEQGLLSRDSLFSRRPGQTAEPRPALEQAFRVLAPYRLFTQSHLRHHVESDPVFERTLLDLGWSIEDLSEAISGTALLSRPLNEPWQEIHGAIRRLLYSYFYKSDERRAAAHSEARKFVEVWAERQTGTEQVIGLVECLWHEAAMLRLSQPAELERALSESAIMLSRALTPSPAYTMRELRSYAVERMQNDTELQEAVGNSAGQFNRLVRLVEEPLKES